MVLLKWFLLYGSSYTADIRRWYCEILPVVMEKIRRHTYVISPVLCYVDEGFITSRFRLLILAIALPTYINKLNGDITSQIIVIK